MQLLPNIAHLSHVNTIIESVSTAGSAVLRAEQAARPFARKFLLDLLAASIATRSTRHKPIRYLTTVRV